MRQSLVGVFFFLSAAACGGPTIGAPCTSTDTVTCKSSTEVYACIGAKWAVAPCGGQQGCTDSAAFNCDLSLATAGTACPPWAEGRSACQGLPPALVSCIGGTWQQTTTCSSCSTASGAPQCTNNNTGGGGGTTGGGAGGGGVTGGGTGGGTTGGGTGGGTTGGGTGGTGGGGGTTCGPGTCAGCCSNGQCLTAPLNGTSAFCGNNGAACDDCGSRGQRCDTASLACVASTSCNPATCASGCCTNGQCFTAPLNATNNFCGTGGGACSDCARIGLVCNGATHSCNTAATGGGGGATGGGAGGGATGGGTGGGATGGGAGGGAADPCQGVPVNGQCLTSIIVRFCSIPTGSGTASVQTYQCPGGSTCQATGSGAACVQTGSCRQDDTRCASATTIQTCGASGTWGAAQNCGGSGCIGSAIGADCAAAVATTPLTGTLRYMSRSPRADLTDWDVAAPVAARNVMVISMRGQQWIDATTTSSTGAFTIKVPTAPGGTDTVLFAAWGGDGLGMRYVVGDPGLGTGTFSPGQQGMNARYWTWSKAVTSLANGGTTTITTAEGSGALNMFDLLQSVWVSSIANNQGRPGSTISFWMGFGTEWSCGACFTQYGGSFDTQIWMPGGSQDEGYWSDYTIAHELGHWQMSSYGTSPNEGGQHTLTCPTYPGQAWSEGYATWHSAAVRNEPFLEDKQGGGFFWFDIGSRTYYPQSGSAMPINGPGGTNLLAQIDENAVSAMLWYISNSRQTGAEEIFNSISSAHMNTEPWPRGYTRRTWDVGSGCTKTNVQNTGEASLHVADMLDALSCGGSPAQSNRVPAATISQTCSSPTSSGNGAYYPYPTASPLCRSGFCYGCKTGTTCNAGNVATACGTGGVQCVACSGGQSCVNGVCL